MPVTNFPGGVSSFGGPVLPSGSVVPLNGANKSGGTTGGVWWVDAVNGASSNSGSSPDYPLATITQALAFCTANGGDIIYVQPGTYTTTASITVSKAKVSIIGLGAGRTGFAGPNITASSISAAMFRIAAAGVTVSGLTFTGEAGYAILDCSTASSFALIQNCEFIVPDSATASAVASTAAWTECQFAGCTFKSLGTTTTIVALNGNRNRITGCTFLATGTSKTVTTGILASSTTIGLLVENCVLMEMGASVYTTGFDMALGTYNLISYCQFNMGTAGNACTVTGTGNATLSCNIASGTV